MIHSGSARAIIAGLLVAVGLAIWINAIARPQESRPCATLADHVRSHARNPTIVGTVLILGGETVALKSYWLLLWGAGFLALDIARMRAFGLSPARKQDTAGIPPESATSASAV